MALDGTDPGTLTLVEDTKVQDVEPHGAAADIAPALRTRNPERVVLCLLLCALILQLAVAYRQLSVTSDEVDHLHAGYRYWQCNDFGWNPEHPPLAKLVDSAPLLFLRINDPFPDACGMPNNKIVDFRVGHDFLFANPESMLTAARATASLFLFGLLLAVWFTARRFFGIGTAMVAGGLLTFEPNLLAHGALVTTDVPAALGLFGAVVSLYWYFEGRCAARLVLVGVCAGIALALKHSSLLLIPIFGLLAIADALLGAHNGRTSLRRAGRNLLALACAVPVAIGILWLSYAFENSRPHGTPVSRNLILNEASGLTATRIIPALERTRILPRSYLRGLQDVLVESEVGRPSFLLGRLYRTGQWFYFPIASLIKFSVPLLVLLGAACFAVRFWRRHLRELAFLSIPAFVVLISAMASGLNIGIRHLLPVLPFAILFASAGALALTQRKAWGNGVLVAALAFHAASSLHASPNYISYSNEFWGGPANTYKYLADSNTDWGQALKTVKTYMDTARPTPCWVIRPYNVLNSDYGIPCGETSELSQEAPPIHYQGTVIVSSSVLAGLHSYLGGPDIFRGHQPIAKLGGSALLVFEGQFDFSRFVALHHLRMAQDSFQADPQFAFNEASQASILDANNPVPHMMMCSASGKLGALDRAERECNVALQLIRRNPRAAATDAPTLRRFMTERGLRVYADEPR
ncbi:MAG: ArnT family glycosyltransferase [Terriglobales bacterium]